MKLKPCPFCGSKARLVRRKSNGAFDIGCENLDCYGWNCTEEDCVLCKDGYVKKEEAIKAWNRRIEE